MPWKPEDVDEHMKGLSQKQKQQWCDIANSAMESCVNNGGKDETCAPKAIKAANGKMKKMMDEMNSMGSRVEHRLFPITNLEMRMNADGKPLVVGYPAKFNSRSQKLYDSFYEEIAPGAFKRTIAQADIRATFNHEPNYILGRMSAGNLKVLEDEVGLMMEVEPPDTQWARDLMVSMRRGDIREGSFVFRTIKDDWSQKAEDGTPVRRLLEAALTDVAVVSFPAYLDTETQVRSVLDRLSFYVPQLPPDPGQDAHSEDAEEERDAQAGVSADLLWRELDLKARQYQISEVK